MNTETIIEVNPARNKATFTHGGVFEMTFVRDKAVRTYRVRVSKDTVRGKDGSAHGVASLCVTKPVSHTGKGKEAMAVCRHGHCIYEADGDAQGHTRWIDLKINNLKTTHYGRILFGNTYLAVLGSLFDYAGLHQPVSVLRPVGAES